MTTTTATRPAHQALTRLIRQALTTPPVQGQTPETHAWQIQGLASAPDPDEQAWRTEVILAAQIPRATTWRLISWAVDWRTLHRDAPGDGHLATTAWIALRDIADELARRGRIARTAAELIRPGTPGDCPF